MRAWLARTGALSGPAVVLGDLNVAPEARDVWSEAAYRDVPTYHPLEHAEWRELVSLGLHDAVAPRVPPGTFSFWDYRGGAFHRKQGVRIDHVLVTAPLLPRVERAWVDRDWRKKREGLAPSDHAPVGVGLAVE